MISKIINCFVLILHLIAGSMVKDVVGQRPYRYQFKEGIILCKYNAPALIDQSDISHNPLLISFFNKYYSGLIDSFFVHVHVFSTIQRGLFNRTDLILVSLNNHEAISIRSAWIMRHNMSNVLAVECLFSDGPKHLTGSYLNCIVDRTGKIKIERYFHFPMLEAYFNLSTVFIDSKARNVPYEFEYVLEHNSRKLISEGIRFHKLRNNEMIELLDIGIDPIIFNCPILDYYKSSQDLTGSPPFYDNTTFILTGTQIGKKHQLLVLIRHRVDGNSDNSTCSVEYLLRGVRNKYFKQDLESGIVETFDVKDTLDVRLVKRRRTVTIEVQKGTGETTTKSISLK